MKSFLIALIFIISNVSGLDQDINAQLKEIDSKIHENEALLIALRELKAYKDRLFRDLISEDVEQVAHFSNKSRVLAQHQV